MGGEGQEIERKFLIDPAKLPYDLAQADEIWKIEQDYICFSPTVRIRQINGGALFILTVKAVPAGGTRNGLVHEEREFLLTADQYRDLKRKREGNTVVKTRYRFHRSDGLTEEIDVFEGTLAGLAYLEVEFPDTESAKAFCPPEWAIADVTEKKAYRNAALARFGLPDDFKNRKNT